MGNHEFCEECGMSSFHYGEACLPKRRAEYQKELEETRKRNERLDAKAKKLCAKLVKKGIPAEINEHGHIVIRKWGLE